MRESLVMGIVQFSPRQSTKEGIVAIGGKLDLVTLRSAYESGVFPWPQEGMPMIWFSPDPRGVIDFSEIHLPKSLKRFIKKNQNFSYSRNCCFERVIEECQKQKRPGQNGTWIIPEMKRAYIQLFEAGIAHSIEVWKEDQLVGGVYGVFSKTSRAQYFSGESMFYKVDNASKLALLELIRWLKSMGLTWLDIQMVTDTTEGLGGKYISREEFLERIGV